MSATSNVGITLSLSGTQQVQAGLDQASRSVQQLGVSANQTAAALRNVPAQFTDIITSLQGGQEPLTVLLQQGGQLKDMFGGIGPAAKALGGYVAGLITPTTALAGAFAALGVAYVKGAAEAEAYTRALILSGNALGTTAGQMADMARAVSGATGGTVGAAADALAQLAASSGIAVEQFKSIGAAATQMELVANVAVKDTVKQFAELGNDPVRASEKLNAATHYLTAEVYQQIKALDDQGDKLGAAKLAQEAYADALNQRIPALRDNLGSLEKGWIALINPAKQAWDAMLNIGREQSPEQKIAALQAKIRDVYLNRSYNPMMADAELLKLQEALQYWMHIADSNRDLAAFQKEQAAQAQASINLSREADKYASRQVQMQREIARAQADYNASAKSDQDTANYQAAVIGIQQKYAETVKLTQAEKESAKFSRESAALLEKLSGYTADYAQQQNTLRTLLDSGRLSQEAYNEAALELVKNQPGMQAVAEAEKAIAKARMESAKAWGAGYADMLKDERKAYDELAAAIARADDALNANERANAEQLDMLEKESSLRGQSASARAAEIEQYKILLKYKQQEQALQASGITDPAVLQSKLDSLNRQKLDALSNAARQAQISEWNTTYDRISDGLTDALMSAGKDGGAGIRDFLEDELLKKPFRMFVQALVQPVAQGMTNAVLGTSVGGSGGLLGNFGNAASLYNMGSTTVGGLFSGATSLGSIFSATGAEVAAAVEYGTAIGSVQTSMLAASEAAFAAEGAVGSLTGALASVPVYGWIAAAVVALLAMGNDKISATGTGEASRNYDDTGRIVAQTIKEEWGGLTSSAEKAITGLYTSYANSAKALGIALEGVTFGFGSNTGKQGENPMVGVASTVNGVTYQSGEVPAADVQIVASRAVFAALQASDLPAHLAGVFDGITASTATQEQISAALQAAQALATFHTALEGLPFDALTAASYAGMQGLIGAAGGLDKLSGNVAGFYDNFYTEAEKFDQSSANLSAAFGKLGIEMPALGEGTDDWYRGLVQAAMATDLSVEANAEHLAGLLALQGGVASLTSSYEQMLTGFFDNFYTEEQNLARNSKNLADDFKKFGVEMPAATESLDDWYTSMVEQALATDLSNTENQRYLTNLLTLQEGVRGIADAHAAAATKVRQSMESLRGAADAYALQQGTTTSSAIAQRNQNSAFADLTAALPGFAGFSQRQVADWLSANAGNDALMGSIVGGADNLKRADAFLNAITATDAALQSAAQAQTSYTSTVDTASTAVDDLAQRVAAAIASLQTEAANLAADLLDAQGLHQEAAAARRAMYEATLEGTTAERARQLTLYDGNLLLRQQIADQNTLNNLQATYAGLEVDLLRAQGKETEALAVQRAIDTKGMTEAQVAVYDLTQARKAEITAIENQKAATKLVNDLLQDVADQGLTDIEKAVKGIERQADDYVTQLVSLGQATAENIAAVASWEAAMVSAARATDTLAASVNSYYDALGSAFADFESAITEVMDDVSKPFDDALAANAEAQKALTDAYDKEVERINALREAAQLAYEEERRRREAIRDQLQANFDLQDKALQDQINAANEVEKARADAYAAAVEAINEARKLETDAYAEANKVLVEQIDAASEAVDKLKRLGDGLDSTLKALRRDDEATRRDLRGGAQAQINEALRIAQSGGELPDIDDLRDALDIIAQPSEDLFASFEDYARDYYKTYNSIDNLNKLTKGQLTEADQTLAVATAAKEAADLAHEEVNAAWDLQLEGMAEANEIARESYDALIESLELQRENLRKNLQIDIDALGLEDLAKAYEEQMRGYDEELRGLAADLAAALGPLKAAADALAKEKEDALLPYQQLLDAERAQTEALGLATNAIARLTAALNALDLAQGTPPPTPITPPIDPTVDRYMAQAQSLYATTPGAVRAPDTASLQYWASEIEAKGMGQAMKDFAAAVEFVNTTIAGWGVATDQVDDWAEVWDDVGQAEAMKRYRDSLSSTQPVPKDPTPVTPEPVVPEPVVPDLSSFDVVKSWYANHPDATKSPDKGALRYWIAELDRLGLDTAKYNFSYAVADYTGKPILPINAFDVGTNYIPEDQVALVHKGERIIPAADNAELMDRLDTRVPLEGQRRTAMALERLERRLAAIEAHTAASAVSGNKVAKSLDRVMPDGDALSIRTAA